MLQKILERAGVEYVENHDVDKMLSLGINDVPVLDVDGELLGYKKATEWLMKKEGEVRDEE